MTEQTKTPEEFIKEVRLKRKIYHDNFPDFIIAQMLRDYKNQFSSPQEVTEEEIVEYANGFASERNHGRRTAFAEGAKWMRSRLTNK